jgi:probable phosphoglycerate mutase
MTQVLLIRHAVNDYVKTGKLAGWTPEVHLNDEGRAQAAALGQRLASAPLAALYASPLERTMETAQAIADQHPELTIRVNEQVGEVRYGEWEGKAIRELTGLKMWRLVQETPSRAYFPGGESMRGVQLRAVEAIETLVAAHPRDLIAVVTHADLIKMVLAHYLGMHLDQFQRIVIGPASISRLQLEYGRPYVSGINDITHLHPSAPRPVGAPSPNV